MHTEYTVVGEYRRGISSSEYGTVRRKARYAGAWRGLRCRRVPGSARPWQRAVGQSEWARNEGAKRGAIGGRSPIGRRTCPKGHCLESVLERECE